MSASRQPGRMPTLQPNSGRETLAGRSAPLDAIFNPATVAVIGATERPNSVGRNTLAALQAGGFAGEVFAVNPNRSTVLGFNSFPAIAQIGRPIDLAVVVTPAPQVPKVITQCDQAGVKGVVIISSGFSTPSGADLQQQIREALRGSPMRVIGPDCLGVLNPALGLNTSFALQMPLGGNIAFLSQSAAICGAVLEWSFEEIVGFSAFASVGAMLDVNWGDLIDYFGRDAVTRSIIIYMESIGDARAFLSAAREVSLTKPIIVVKAGRSPAAARAVATHTGCDAGCDEVLDAAFRRAGVLRVDHLSDLFSVADALSKQPRPKGRRVMVVSNALSSSVLAADAVTSAGLELPALSAEGCTAFADVISPESSNDNPIVLLNATPETYVKAVEMAEKEPDCDGVIAVIVPLAMSDPAKAGEMLLSVHNTCGKPILACFTGWGAGARVSQTLARACIPTFAFPGAAARAFNYMWRYSYNVRGLYETPVRASGASDNQARTLVQSMVHASRDATRSLLGDAEAKRILAAYGIQTIARRIARTEADAVRIATEIGFPVSLTRLRDDADADLPSGDSSFIAFDSEGIRRAWDWLMAEISGKPCTAVGLEPFSATDNPYRVAIGSRIDPQFGPVLWAGDRLTPVGDRAFALPPLNSTLARRMMEQTRCFSVVTRAISGAGDALAAALVRFSELVIEQPWIKTIEINPLLVTTQGVIASSARIVLHGPEITEAELPRPTIRPYPVQYVSHWKMKDGQMVTFRPIRAEDEPLMVKFHEGLSEQSVYLRFFQQVKLSQRTQHDRLTRICFIDYDREMALVAEHRDPLTDERRIVALGSLSKVHGRNEGEVAVIISDDCQGRGLGSEMMRRLIAVARNERLDGVIASTMFENRQMTAILKHLGFQVAIDYDDQLVKAEMKL